MVGYSGRRNSGLLGKEPSAIRGSCLKALDRTKYSFACFAYCQEVCLSNLTGRVDSVVRSPVGVLPYKIDGRLFVCVTDC